jgi:hypothetical protein
MELQSEVQKHVGDEETTKTVTLAFQSTKLKTTINEGWSWSQFISTVSSKFNITSPRYSCIYFWSYH